MSNQSWHGLPLHSHCYCERKVREWGKIAISEIRTRRHCHWNLEYLHASCLWESQRVNSWTLLDILGLAKVRWTETCETTTEVGYKIFGIAVRKLIISMVLVVIVNKGRLNCYMLHANKQHCSVHCCTPQEHLHFTRIWPYLWIWWGLNWNILLNLRRNNQ